jgi:hypothetical protein
MIGNVEPALHAHIFPRFESEPESLRLKPAWFYDWDAMEKFNLGQQKPFILELKEGLQALNLVIDTQSI